MKKKDKISLPATDEGRMTIYEYEQKYAKKQNAGAAGRILRWGAAAVGLVILALLASLFLKIYQINHIAGYISGGVLALLFIFIYIVPIVRLLGSSYFQTNVNYKTAKAAIKHNRKLRREIALKMIDFSSKTGNAGWYDGATVEMLDGAVKADDNGEIKRLLSELYRGSVKKSGRDLILKSALKSAAFSAISQAQNVDAAIILAVNLQLIRDIVFLYGFRPSDARLLKIFFRVLQNSLVAYGLGGIRIGNAVVKTMGDAVRGIPLLGSAISAIVDSSVQGLANGTLTAVIGYQTIKYLNDEYRLQSILDDVVLGGEEELRDTCRELETELKAGKAKTA